jgi:hypothetical protein
MFGWVHEFISIASTGVVPVKYIVLGGGCTFFSGRVINVRHGRFKAVANCVNCDVLKSGVTNAPLFVN